MVIRNGARGRIRTCTRGALDAGPLMLGYTSKKWRRSAEDLHPKRARRGAVRSR